ncbi:hypothetical protein TNCV_3534671 [Trichonephila clavipes]|nr:hypothetical protein TNCV_3534671 [Trichonephila clavipes]
MAAPSSIDTKDARRATIRFFSGTLEPKRRGRLEIGGMEEYSGVYAHTLEISLLQESGVSALGTSLQGHLEAWANWTQCLHNKGEEARLVLDSALDHDSNNLNGQMLFPVVFSKKAGNFGQYVNCLHVMTVVYV